MRRGPKPAKSTEAKPPVGRKSSRDDDARVRDLEKRLADAQEREQATGEILRVISSSPNDLQPVFDAIVRSASRLCGGEYAIVTRYDGELLHLAAQYNPRPGTAEETARSFPRVVRQDASFVVRALVTGAVVHVADVDTDDLPPEVREVYGRIGLRAALCVPMLQEGRPVGVVAVSRGTPGAFTSRQIDLLQTFAAQALIAIENGRLFKELQTRNAQVSEALEQQTATSDILRVIASSPTDIQPVLDVMAESSARLCGASDALIRRVEGDVLRLVAHYGPVQGAGQGLPLNRGSIQGRAVLDRQTIHVHDFAAVPEEYPIGWEVAQRHGHRTMLATPLLREGVPIGAIVIRRLEVQPFTDKQIALLKTFADQAVIAIENVRLFKELEARNRELTDALDRQTATSEILSVISRSPTDVQPVFDTIVESAARLCDAVFGGLGSFDGQLLDIVAAHNWTPAAWAIARRTFPAPPSRAQATGRAILERAVVHVPDVELDHEYGPSEISRAVGFRSILSVPMLRDGVPLGAIAVGRLAPGPFSDNQIALLKTFADQAVIAIENVRLFKELETRNRDLTEALDRQTATGDILRVISQSPTEVQPVFDAIVASAVRLCGGVQGNVVRFDGELVHRVAGFNLDPEGEEAFRDYFPRALGRELAITRSIQDGSVVHVPDTLQDTDHIHELAQATRARALLAVPMLRDGQPIGAISVARREARPFSDSQIALLQTFADQAVIAIENVRLFTETKEALERQTATSEILQVISSSPTDLQPVFDAIAHSAVSLCEGSFAGVDRFDGKLIHRVAQHNIRAQGKEALERAFPMLPSRRLATGRAVLQGRVIHIADVEADLEYDHDISRAVGMRSVLAVPLLRQSVAIGAIGVARDTPTPFSDQQIELLKTFADQAVIAIENVRLFTETREALEQQTATAEILRVISSSPTDIQPVLDAVAESAARLCEAYHVSIWRRDGDRVLLVAHLGAMRQIAALPLVRGTVAGRTVLDAETIHIADLQIEDDEFPESSVNARQLGFRAILSVPLIREGVAIGCIVIRRREVELFTDRQVSLLQTFADQAVIAIENVRLFTELQARTQELTRSVEQLTALGEVGQAITSTLDLQTVLSTIVARATQLTGVDAGVIYEYDAERELFEPRATERLEEDIVQMLEATPIRKGQGATGRLAESPEPMQVADLRDVATQIPARDALVRGGYRAVLAVPLVREGHLIGGLTVFRKTPGEFALGTVDLLRTFATQSALAIQNARLFREIEDKSRQLEVASQHKSEFLANMSHELRTPLNAIIGFSEVLSERMFGDLNEKQDEYLKDIYASGTHLLSLINDILDLSKIEAGRMELELTDFDLPQAIDNALTLVRERAGRRGIALHQSVEERLGEIKGDERKVKQVLLNLLSNALKFTPEGGRVEVRARVVDGMAEISVTDTGVGIAPEDQEAVFEEFRQVGTAEKKAEGTGLGLTLCRKFIELQGGRIWVTSQVGAGSTFTFTIPVRRGE